jgi:putative sterol carrier protein
VADLFSPEWAEAARNAIDTFPDDEYRATKLQMYWDWIDVAKQGFEGSLTLRARDHDRCATFRFTGGKCASVDVSDQVPDDSTFVLAGDLQTFSDILEGYDAGKAVMYRRLRLEKGDVFRFFNRIYLFTESLVALSKVPATLPA